MTLSFALWKGGETGFPLGDNEIYKFLRSPSGSNLEVHARAISLLEAIAQTSMLLISTSLVIFC